MTGIWCHSFEALQPCLRVHLQHPLVLRGPKTPHVQSATVYSATVCLHPTWREESWLWSHNPAHLHCLNYAGVTCVHLVKQKLHFQKYARKGGEFCLPASSFAVHMYLSSTSPQVPLAISPLHGWHYSTLTMRQSAWRRQVTCLRSQLLTIKILDSDLGLLMPDQQFFFPE